MRSVISGSIYLYILLVFISGFEKKSNVVATAPSSSSSFGNRLRLFGLSGGSQLQQQKKDEGRQFGEYRADLTIHADTRGCAENEGDHDVFRQTETHETLQVTCEINGYPVNAIIDTGAQLSIMSTKFAKKCDLYSSIDRRFAGRAVGVGSSEILGRSTTRVRLGAMQFKSDFSVLENTRIDFIIGLDILRKYQCVVCLRENVVKLHYQNKVFRVPIMLPSNPMSYDTESNVESVSADNSDTFYDTGTKSFHYEDEDSEDIGIYESVSMEGW